jgi:hypothetical protein
MMKRRVFLGGTFGAVTLGSFGAQSATAVAQNTTVRTPPGPLVWPVVTHCGWSRQKANTPDSSTKLFVEKAVEIAQEYAAYFSDPDVEYAFYLLDDFHSCGRISRNQRIPISNLISGQKYPVDSQRLEVNPSVDRYKKEIQNLATDL